MSIGVLHGQTGGIKLPFRVIGGTTQPSNPKDGDIWVKTSVPIMRTEFANGTWASGGVGLVFLAGTLGGSNPTGANSTVWAINKNTGTDKYILKITLTGCKQVQGSKGNWVNLDAYRYYGGTWVQFSSEFTATINITYPAGSTCTVTDGTTTLTAPNTSGTWACVVLNAGTWTARCGIIQKAVTVSTSGITVPVDLTIMELFDNGNQYIDITGGWTNNTGFMYNSSNTGKGTVTIGESIRCVAGPNTSAYASTVKKVNLSGYKNITVTVTDLGSKSYELVIMPIVGYMQTNAVAYATLASAITTLPISLEGEYYICVGTGGEPSVEVTSVVLEV